jgi:hypothetical protein
VLGGRQGSGLTVLGLILWALVLGIAAAGGLLLARGRPIAGVGAVATAATIVVAFPYAILGVVWTVLFFVGVGPVA